MRINCLLGSVSVLFLRLLSRPIAAVFSMESCSHLVHMLPSELLLYPLYDVQSVQDLDSRTIFLPRGET